MSVVNMILTILISILIFITISIVVLITISLTKTHYGLLTDFNGSLLYDPHTNTFIENSLENYQQCRCQYVMYPNTSTILIFNQVFHYDLIEETDRSMLLLLYVPGKYYLTVDTTKKKMIKNMYPNKDSFEYCNEDCIRVLL